MKTYPVILAALLVALACQGQPQLPPRLPPSPGMPPGSAPAVAPAKDPVNYLIRVEWKDAKKDNSTLQVVTTEGNFSLDTISGAVKVNDFDVPTTVKLSGALTELSPEKGKLQLFLGRTVPYVTSTYSGPSGRPSSSYSQLSVGLSSTFTVVYGKPLLIQSDGSGEVTILVKRLAD